MKERLKSKLLHSFKLKGPLKKKTNEFDEEVLIGTIDFSLPISELESCARIMSEDELLQMIGFRLIEVIMHDK